jgi:Ca2+:H+ antiporter
VSRVERILLAVVAVVFVAAAALHYGNGPDVAAFFAATLALAGLAWVVSFATEQVGERFGPAVTGVLQSTLGNLPEFFIVVFALSAGEVVVAQFTIIGSIFANGLFVLGLVIATGAYRAPDGIMRFSPRLPNDTSTLLLSTVFIIVVCGASAASSDPASSHIEAISIVGAVAILIVYLAWLIPYLRNDEGVETMGPARISLAFAVVLLSVAGVAAAFTSDWFVNELTPTIDKLGISKVFAGLVIAAIAGNAVENAAGVYLAWKERSDLAISVVKNSVSQISAFLWPALILVSAAFTHQLTFELPPVYIGALALGAVVIWQTTGDGETPMFEGLALVAVYVVLATLTLYE